MFSMLNNIGKINTNELKPMMMLRKNRKWISTKLGPIGWKINLYLNWPKILICSKLNFEEKCN